MLVVAERDSGGSKRQKFCQAGQDMTPKAPQRKEGPYLR